MPCSPLEWLAAKVRDKPFSASLARPLVCTRKGKLDYAWGQLNWGPPFLALPYLSTVLLETVAGNTLHGSTRYVRSLEQSRSVGPHTCGIQFLELMCEG